MSQNILTSEVEKYKSILTNINFLTEEFKVTNNIKTYEEVINSGFLNQETKKEYISHLKSYESYIAYKIGQKLLMLIKRRGSLIY